MPADGDEYIAAARASRELHLPWIHPPLERSAWLALMARNAGDDAQLLLCRLRESDALVGSFQLSQIFRGGFQNAFLGFFGVAGHDGRGLMTEGLELMLAHVFVTLDLHRVEANVQPGNARSRALVERCGFRHEGFSPRYLRIGGEWRDHERYAITVEDWQARRR